MTFADMIGLAGLASDMIGVVIVWRFGFPRPQFEESTSISVEDATLLGDGRTAAEHADDARKMKVKYTRMSNLGISLIMFGFALQAVAKFVN